MRTAKYIIYYMYEENSIRIRCSRTSIEQWRLFNYWYVLMYRDPFLLQLNSAITICMYVCTYNIYICKLCMRYRYYSVETSSCIKVVISHFVGINRKFCFSWNFKYTNTVPVPIWCCLYKYLYLNVNNAANEARFS